MDLRGFGCINHHKMLVKRDGKPLEIFCAIMRRPKNTPESYYYIVILADGENGVILKSVYIKDVVFEYDYCLYIE